MTVTTVPLRDDMAGDTRALLASVGVYAMFTSLAAAREQEFGVRVALGSSRSAIAALVLRQGAAWMAAGRARATRVDPITVLR